MAALRSALAGVRGEPFELSLGDVGTFGGRRRPRVVWLGLAGGIDRLRVLAGAAEQACRDAGLEPEDRPFRAHLTLARAADRFGSDLPDLPKPPPTKPWQVSSFVLYESRLGRGPAVYVPIEEFELSPAR